MSYQLQDLLYCMARLRNSETGCPWDLKQDFHTILPHTLEEAYEVADAIERRDWPHLEEELGDLLFQVIFYGQLGQEQQYFSVTTIIDKLVQKLIRRHPHVFPAGTLDSERDAAVTPEESEVAINWDAIKQQEKAAEPANSVLSDVPMTLPALQRAVKLQKKASKVGFDWSEIGGVVAKVHEELQEVEDELEPRHAERLQHEIGDLLFAVTNLARHLNIDPEVALRCCNQRFSQRFAHVETVVEQQGGWQQVNAEQMEEAWQQAKRQASES
jgi:ATP diphosphatase